MEEVTTEEETPLSAEEVAAQQQAEYEAQIAVRPTIADLMDRLNDAGFLVREEDEVRKFVTSDYAELLTCLNPALAGVWRDGYENGQEDQQAGVRRDDNPYGEEVLL